MGGVLGTPFTQGKTPIVSLLYADEVAGSVLTCTILADPGFTPIRWHSGIGTVPKR